VSPPIIAFLVGAAICAAGGQLLFAAGARGRTDLLSFLNLQIVIGLVLYALGTGSWIYSLSRAPLIQVYPFTVLTFALIYVGSVVIFGERPSGPGLCGVALVLVGLYLITAK
jgi:drug/metabolite transporter (DMT)-like permease